MKVQNDFPIDLTGIGNACVDIVAECDFNFLDRHSVHKSHCIYVDLPTLDRLKAELTSPILIPGGAAANTIYAYECLGGKAAFLGKIAEDFEGRMFEKSMTDIGIETGLKVEIGKDIGSTQVVCLRTPDGDRSFVTYQGVAETIAIHDIDFGIVEKSRIVYFDGYTMYSPNAFDIFMKAAATAKRTGGLSVFNPGDLSIVEQYTDKVRTLVRNIDPVICNLAEARAIFQVDTLTEAAHIIPSLQRSGVVTDGENGAIVFSDNEIIHMPKPVPPDTEIHTLGAGDHFAAGFLYGRTNGYSLKNSAQLAELCALDCLSHPGARPLGSLKHLIDRLD